VEEHPVDEELVCTICHRPLLDPVIEPGCRQMFCRRCIEGWLAQSTSCPQCWQLTSTTAVAPPASIYHQDARRPPCCLPTLLRTHPTQGAACPSARLCFAYAPGTRTIKFSPPLSLPQLIVASCISVQLWVWRKDCPSQALRTQPRLPRQAHALPCCRCGLRVSRFAQCS
jgi:hypothetical protein